MSTLVAFPSLTQGTVGSSPTFQTIFLTNSTEFNKEKLDCFPRLHFSSQQLSYCASVERFETCFVFVNEFMLVREDGNKVLAPFYCDNID